MSPVFRGCLAALAALGIVVVGLALWLLVTAPDDTEPVALASPERLKMLGFVPADASEIAVIPRAAGLYRRMRAEPVAARAARALERQQHLAALPWLGGDSDLVIWKDPRGTGYVLAPDAARRALLHAYVWWAGAPEEVSWQGRYVIIGFGGRPLESESIRSMVALAEGLRGEAFLFELVGSRRSFPPLPRPSVSTASFRDGSIEILSRARAGSTSGTASIPFGVFPREAMLSVATSGSAEWSRNLDRLLPVNISGALDRGALLALYKVDRGGLLPKLRGVAVIPESSRSEQLLRGLESMDRIGGGPVQRRRYHDVEIVRRTGLGFVIEYARSGGTVLLAFDRSSIEQYLSDRLAPLDVPLEGTLWSLTLRPEILAPAVDQLRDRQELSILAPGLHRTIRSLHRWMEYFPDVPSMSIVRRSEGSWETVRLRVSGPK